MTSPIEFSVSIPDPHTHLLNVEMAVPELEDDRHVDLQMPVWSPGSYKIREYSRHVQNLEAAAPSGEPLDHRKLDKATWRVECGGNDVITVTYEVYAHTLNVREKHVDGSHAFYQPTAVYLYPADRLDAPAELRVEPPRDDWSVYCGLESASEADHHFRAPDFDALFDAPVEMGDHEELTFEVDGVPHRMAFWGDGDWDRPRLERDLPQIVASNAAMFDDLPYDDYTFITLLSDGAYGGLEHRNSTSLIYPQDEFGDPPEDRSEEPPIEDDDYLNFLSLVAHEHFHAWNVKRLYPEAIEDFDYQSENYVPELWTIEGITSYYDRQALYRGGLVDVDRYLEFLADRIARYENTPGRNVQSLREAGYDAWIKLYLSDEQTVNSSVSYYLKGALVALLLDLRLQRATEGERSLDDVVQRLWSEYGAGTDRGYPDGIYRELAEEVGGRNFETFFDRYVHGTAAIEWEREFDPFGVTLERRRDEDAPEVWLGVEPSNGSRGVTVEKVRADGPAHGAALYPGDEILAVEGWTVEDPDAYHDRLDELRPGAAAQVHVDRRGRLCEAEVPVERRPYDAFEIRRQATIDADQRALLTSWLGTDDVDIADAQETEPS